MMANSSENESKNTSYVRMFLERTAASGRKRHDPLTGRCKGKNTTKKDGLDALWRRSGQQLNLTVQLPVARHAIDYAVDRENA